MFSLKFRTRNTENKFTACFSIEDFKKQVQISSRFQVTEN